MDEKEFRHNLKVDVTELELWIEQGWLAPLVAQARRHFRDADVARARLILDLTRDMGVNEAGVAVVMDLVDQIHSLRSVMRDLVLAVSSQDTAVKQRLHATLVGLSKAQSS
jgi:chaperone modulatory protein CbpM